MIGRKVLPGCATARGQANITDGKTRKCAGNPDRRQPSGRPDGRADNSYGADEVARGHAGSVSQEPRGRKGFIASESDSVYDRMCSYTLGATVRTNIDIDDELLAEAMTATGLKTKKAVVEEGLRLAVENKRRRDALDRLWGIGWYGDLDEIRGAPTVRAAE